MAKKIDLKKLTSEQEAALSRAISAHGRATHDLINAGVPGDVILYNTLRIVRGRERRAREEKEVRRG